MAEQAQRLAPANLSLRDRIERRLRPEAGSGSPDTALIAGLAQTHGTVQQLRQYLEISQQMNPIPELHMQPEPDAPYGLVDEVLAVTKRARVEKMGFVGNEAYMEAF